MSQETMKLALEALLLSDTVFYPQTKIAIAAIEEALANHCEDNLNMVKQEQGEPVACLHRLVDVTNPVVKSGYMCMDCGAVFRAYVTPQQRKPLTNENPLLVFAKECVLGAYSETELADAAFRAIEAAHDIKE